MKVQVVKMNERPSLLNVLEVETRSSSGKLSVSIIGINKVGLF